MYWLSRMAVSVLIELGHRRVVIVNARSFGEGTHPLKDVALHGASPATEPISIPTVARRVIVLGTSLPARRGQEGESRENRSDAS